MTQPSKRIRTIKVYVGECDGVPHFWRDPNYYKGVRRGDIFTNKREAKKCYQSVYEAELIIKNSL